MTCHTDAVQSVNSSAAIVYNVFNALVSSTHLASELYSSLSDREPSSSTVHECPPRRDWARSR